jgi:hypothetical protein
MIRILCAVGFALLLTDAAMAQAYCDQVKQAVATYGYAAAKAHALAHYTRHEVAVADKCLTGGGGGGHQPKRKAKS